MHNLCFETIKIEDGLIHNITWHNRRCNLTRKELFGVDKPLNLETLITPPQTKGVFRCRLRYNQEVVSVEYIPYATKTFQTFKIVESDIKYNYKYANRAKLDNLKAKFSSYDEIIISQNGLITDTSIANIAFYTGEEWITPQKPLLKGTMRAKLLNESFLVERKIKSEALKHFSHFALMNAMIGFKIQKNSTIYTDTNEIICL
ncbi:MAG: aminotransferase class IV [Epsilonproteobacteria bacterium]|nr:aminotransferase class IV [Campylobacterota bacterium]